MVRSDEFYASLNPGIRKTVRLLHEAGFDTCDSGDGETHECDRDHGYVVVRPGRYAFSIESATNHVFLLLKIRGFPMSQAGEGVHVQGTCVPGEPSLVDISFIHDRMLDA